MDLDWYAMVELQYRLGRWSCGWTTRYSSSKRRSREARKGEINTMLGTSWMLLQRSTTQHAVIRALGKDRAARQIEDREIEVK